MATWSQLTLQDAGSPIMEEFIFFHDFSLIILSMILIFVGGIMSLMLSNPWINIALSESQLVECIWTILPALVLTQLAIPSLYLLYMMDESASNALTLKIMAHQWYWSYEYSDFWTSPSNLEFDSYMEPNSSSNFRLLDTDNRVVLPYNTPIRGLVSSADVLHAWAIPALGVKSDACPGRLNQIKLTSFRPGLWFGQCSEICGANHSFMPIVLEMINTAQFLKWVELNQE